MRIFPGRSFFSPPKVSTPPPPPPQKIPEPVEEVSAPKVEADKKTVQTKSKNRKGRAASILTGTAGDQGGLGVIKRPGATGDKLG